MKYFKAQMFLATEQMDYDPKEKAYVSYDPDTWTEHGVIQTWTAETLEDLKSQIAKTTRIEDFEVFEGRLEAEYEGEHDYRTPAEEQVPFREMFTLIIEEVSTTEVDASYLKEVC